MDQANSKDNKRKNDISILVVDDREDNLLSIETILENDQYHVVKANSGRAALHRISPRARAAPAAGPGSPGCAGRRNSSPS